MNFIKEIREKRKILVLQWSTYVRGGTPDKYGNNDRIYNSHASIMVGRIRMLTDILADEAEFYEAHPELGPVNVTLPRAIWPW